MFTDIERRIADSMLSIRGEFSDVQLGRARAIPFSVQVQRLQVITAFTREKFNPKHFVYIGHSQGNFVIAETNPTNSQVFLLAPPVGYDKFIQTPGWKKPESHLDTEGQSQLARSDLTIDVGPEFWREFETVDANALYSRLAQNNKVEMVVAGEDMELGSQELPAHIPKIVIPKANHDFKDASRGELILAILKDIKKEPGHAATPNPEIERHTVEQIIGDYKTFFSDLLKRLSEVDINIKGKDISHICYRVDTANYEKIRDRLKNLSSAYAEHEVGGRNVAELMLKSPLDLGNGQSTQMVELLPHKAGRPYTQGLENIGVVIGNELPEFGKRHKAKLAPSPKDRGSDLQIPYITFEPGKTVKFYDRSLEQIVKERGSSFIPTAEI